MKKQDVAALKVGDAICYCRTGGLLGDYKFATIKKITPSGQIVTSDDVKFNDIGYEIGGSKHRKAWLTSIEEGKSFLAQREEQQKNGVLITKLEGLLKKQYAAVGCWLSEKERDLVTQLTAALEEEETPDE